MRKLIFLVLMVIFIAPSANAVQVPRIVGSEKRFRVYVYNPNEVYRYVGYYLYQSYIEFEESETVVNISMGDSTAWQMQVLGNKLFLKPILPYADTNMTLMTNKRIYHFELDATDARIANDDNILFYVKFMYPDSQGDRNLVTFSTKKVRDDYPNMEDISRYNFNYEFSGTPSIAPIKIFDDGEFTYIEFPNKNTEIPAIFAVNNGGYEELVNFRVVEEYVVLERVGSQFTLRSGNDIVCIYNNSIYRFRNY